MKREKFYIEIIDKCLNLTTHLQDEIFIGSKTGAIKHAKDLVRSEQEEKGNSVNCKYLIWTLDELKYYYSRNAHNRYLGEVVKQMEEI